MSLHPQTNFDIPEETITVARAAFPKGNLYMKMRDELGTIYHDELFSELYLHRGRPAQAPWRLALVTVMQFAENLSDHLAADAVRARINWKYALSLALDDPGFDFSILSDFRARLLDGGAEELLFEQMLDLFKGRDLLKAGGRQRTDSTHIIASVRALNRLELVGETLLHALNEITQVDPAWLKAHVTPDWFERYGSRFSNKDCAACTARSLCTRRKTGPRELTLPEQAHYEALQQARQRQESEAFQKQYAARSGIEGTISQAVFALGMRRSRYRGQAKLLWR